MPVRLSDFVHLSTVFKSFIPAVHNSFLLKTDFILFACNKIIASNYSCIKPVYDSGLLCETLAVPESRAYCFIEVSIFLCEVQNQFWST